MFPKSLCNAVTRAYLKEITSNLESERQRRYEALQRAAQQADRQLEEMWNALNGVATSIGSDSAQSLTIRDEIQLQAYREYAQQLRRAQLRGNELQSLLTEEQLKTVASDESLDRRIEEQLRHHADVAAVQDQLAAIDSRIAQMQGIAAQDDSPQLKRLNEERALLATKVENIVNSLRPQMCELAREQRRTEVEASVTQLRSQIELNQAEKEFLHSRMEEIDTTTVRTDKKNGIQLEMARHAVDRQTRLADALSQSLAEFKIESKCPLPVALIEWAPLPGKPNRSRQLKGTAGAAGVGWLLAILGVGTLEWRGRRVRSGDDVKAHFTRPVFGTYPVKDHRRGRIRTSHRRVQRSTRGGGPLDAWPRPALRADDPERHGFQRVGDGASASRCARAGARVRGFHRRTLLVDCDLSGTSLSQQLGAAQSPGLIQLSAGARTRAGASCPRPRRASTSCRWACPKGPRPKRPRPKRPCPKRPCPKRPRRGWIRRRCDYVLRLLRSSYDAIVVNGPAIMSSAESLLLASQVDQTVLAVFLGTTRWNELAASEELAGQAGIAVLGAVLHAGDRAATLELMLDRQGASRPVSAAALTTEEDLRADIAAMRARAWPNRDLPRAVAHPGYRQHGTHFMNHECARYFGVKSVVDRVITAILMIVALPMMLLIGLAILICDGRPVLYRQTRVGRHGRVFLIWKFRTMCRDAESTTGAVWGSDCDPRHSAGTVAALLPPRRTATVLQRAAGRHASDRPASGTAGVRLRVAYGIAGLRNSTGRAAGDYGAGTIAVWLRSIPGRRRAQSTARCAVRAKRQPVTGSAHSAVYDPVHGEAGVSPVEGRPVDSDERQPSQRGHLSRQHFVPSRTPALSGVDA